MVTVSEYGYVSVTDTAKLIRAQLKAQFPDQKFSVKSDKYAGGASINVSWTDGPTDSAVYAVVNGFSGQNFDGMIDMAYSKQAWLEDDGSAHLAYSPGTAGQRGSDPERVGSPRTPGARMVHFHADYVFTHREFSEEFLDQVAETLDRPFWGQCRACGGTKDQEGFVVRTQHRGYTHDTGACVAHAPRAHASSVDARTMEVTG